MADHVVPLALTPDEEQTLDVLAQMSGRTPTSLLRSFVTQGLDRAGADPLVVDHRRQQLRVMEQRTRSRVTDEQVVEFIKTFTVERGYAPAVRDVCEAFDWASPSTAHARLRQLRAKGLLRARPESPRTLRAVETVQKAGDK